MKITSLLTDDAVLAEIGVRLTAARLRRDLTQEQVAAEAGVSKTTVERAETGKSTTLPNFLRILRTLDLIDGLEQLLAPPPSPIEPLRTELRHRQRATGRRGRPGPQRRASGGPGPGGFLWGDGGPPS